MKILYILFAISSILTASESMSDLRIAVDPFDAKNRSHLDFVSQTSFDSGVCSFLVNPEIAFYLNRSVDFGLSLGHRWQVGAGAIGHHVFFDRSQMPKISVNQFGTGIDWLTPNFDVRANYYHPISPAVALKDRLVKPCKWLEAEAVFKTPYFNVAAGPNFNFDNSVMGIQSRFVIPFERFSLGLGASTDGNKKREVFLLTSFHLYRDKGAQYYNIPAAHTKRPKVEFITIKIKHKKEELPKKVDEKDLLPAENEPTESPISPAPEEEEISFDESAEQYWKERMERERHEAENEIAAPPQVPMQPEEKSLWDTFRDWFWGSSQDLRENQDDSSSAVTSVNAQPRADIARNAPIMPQLPGMDGIVIFPEMPAPPENFMPIFDQQIIVVDVPAVVADPEVGLEIVHEFLIEENLNVPNNHFEPQPDGIVDQDPNFEGIPEWLFHEAVGQADNRFEPQGGGIVDSDPTFEDIPDWFFAEPDADIQVHNSPNDDNPGEINPNYYHEVEDGWDTLHGERVNDDWGVHDWN